MDAIRADIRSMAFVADIDVLAAVAAFAPGAAARADISKQACAMVDQLRHLAKPSMMELFLGEYGLSSDEGVALMCLAEALLRVPDAATMDALIEDKITPSEWGKHLGESHSTLINASTWALFVTGQVLDEPGKGVAGVLRGAIKRLGEPVIRQAVARVMREMGQQFVLGQTIQKAIMRAKALEAQSYSYSYDMLGEAAMNNADARSYYMAYADAISQIAKAASGDDIRTNPGISIKLSALHPKYDLLHRDQVMRDLVPHARSLALLAKSAGIGLNIDAEEAARLDLSLDVIAAVLSEPSLAGWDGFGVVVQAYGKRASHVIDWLYLLAQGLDRRIMVRLVKGAYWDSEIKLAQVDSLPGFPVLAAKHHTDVNYICCAVKLLAMSDRIYPQFATHNAHTIAAVLHSASEQGTSDFEFQRLHGMGEALHDQVVKAQGVQCRIYAPVGHHSDLLAYLVRRLLESGANSSFVNQIFDADVPSALVGADPFKKLGEAGPQIAAPQDIFRPTRPNSMGFDLSDPLVLAELQAVRANLQNWDFGDLGDIQAVMNPATGAQIGQVRYLSPEQAAYKVEAATPWHASQSTRAQVLRQAANLYEAHAGELFALLTHEAGKTLSDCIGELREAVDFLRYYAAEAERQQFCGDGIFTCISPWNFPLAIFTGQIAAALAAGNGVLTKPAENTSMIAHVAVELLHRAGVPVACLQLVAGEGAVVGPVLCSATKISGVCFTGSTATAQRINRTMADWLSPAAPLIAETGGLNAMVVDSTALLEQAVGDVLVSAFQSAGQRCSALRVLYVQSDIAAEFQKMLFGAMQALVVGNPADVDCDVGPVIDRAAQAKILHHIARSKVLFQTRAPDIGTFVAPTVLAVQGIGDLSEELFGPVLHLATFSAADLDQVIDDINASGYGLTFGFHSRIDDRVQRIVSRIDVGNLYINRNQIGAVVGSQPFGGHGLSGTGPKAGGPRYLLRFAAQHPLSDHGDMLPVLSVEQVTSAFDAKPAQVTYEVEDLPGPTGESNRYVVTPKSRVLCMGPGAEKNALRARALGCRAVAASLDPKDLAKITDLDAVIYGGGDGRRLRQALSQREGPIVPLLMDEGFETWLLREQSICIDTTAAGGNAALLAS
jgi:RHH-type proline utilization regulon transcriptional repressor/proline dehydrogenase/delta 1-pyrroline-5-carboxylate dehydrogenase